MASEKFLTLAILYFIQGVPYGFQARFLPIYQRENNISLTNIGLLKMLLWPWLLKPLWAPFVDKWKTEWHWLIGSIFIVFLACFVGIFTQPEYTVCWCLLLLLINIGTATQDIAVDSVAVKSLSFDQLNRANVIQAVAYKCGAAFGGGILAVLLFSLGISGIFVCLSGLYFLSVIFIYFSPTLNAMSLRSWEKSHNKTSKQKAEEKSYNAKFFREVLMQRETLWMTAYVLTYKLGKISIIDYKFMESLFNLKLEYFFFRSMISFR